MRHARLAHRGLLPPGRVGARLPAEPEAHHVRHRHHASLLRPGKEAHSSRYWPFPCTCQANVALASGTEPQGVGGGHVHSGPDGQLSLQTKFELSRTILAIPMYLLRQMLPLPVAMNPKELVCDMSIVVLMAKASTVHLLVKFPPFRNGGKISRKIFPGLPQISVTLQFALRPHRERTPSVTLTPQDRTSASSACPLPHAQCWWGSYGSWPSSSLLASSAR